MDPKTPETTDAPILYSESAETRLTIFLCFVCLQVAVSIFYFQLPGSLILLACSVVGLLAEAYVVRSAMSSIAKKIRIPWTVTAYDVCRCTDPDSPRARDVYKFKGKHFPDKYYVYITVERRTRFFEEVDKQAKEKYMQAGFRSSLWVRLLSPGPDKIFRGNWRHSIKKQIYDEAREGPTTIDVEMFPFNRRCDFKDVGILTREKEEKKVHESVAETL